VEGISGARVVRWCIPVQSQRHHGAWSAAPPLPPTDGLADGADAANEKNEAAADEEASVENEGFSLAHL